MRQDLRDAHVVDQYSYALMRAMSKIIGQNVDYSGVSHIGQIWYIIVSVFLAGFFFAVIVGA